MRMLSWVEVLAQLWVMLYAAHQVCEAYHLQERRFMKAIVWTALGIILTFSAFQFATPNHRFVVVNMIGEIGVILSSYATYIAIVLLVRERDEARLRPPRD